MTNPVFVETSAGFINLSMVQLIRKSKSENNVVRFCFAEENLVSISETEWHTIRDKMAHLILINFE
jgi:hypothetical protein